MITGLNVASIYVLDKDEALDFYVNKLGLEVGSDFTQGDYRWRAADLRAVPACFAKAWTRPSSSFGEAKRQAEG